MRRRLLRSVLVALATCLLLAATACQVRTEVAIDVEPDGSGVVTVSVSFDGTAARRLGDPGTGLRLDDLRDAGWEFDLPVGDDDGGFTLIARRGFAAPGQLATVLAEVGGAAAEDGTPGVFSDVHLGLDDGFGRTDYEFAATVHLTGNPEQFSDAELAAALDGLPLARTPEELVAAGALDPDGITLKVLVSLPGDDLDTNGDVEDDRRGAGESAAWRFSVTGGEPTAEELVASSAAVRGRTWWLVGIAAVALAGAAVTATVGLVRRRT